MKGELGISGKHSRSQQGPFYPNRGFIDGAYAPFGQAGSHSRGVLQNAQEGHDGEECGNPTK